MDSEFSTEINYYTLGEPHLHVKGSCTRDVKGAISKHVAALVVADTHNTSFQSPFFFSSRRAKWAIEAARFDRKFFFFFLEEAAFSNRVQRHRTNMMIKLSVSYVTQKCKCPFSFRRTPIWDILWFVTFFFRGLVCMASDRGIRATAAMWLRVCFWQGERHICSTTPFARFATGPCRVHRTAASVATNGTMTVHMLWSTLDTCP